MLKNNSKNKRKRQKGKKFINIAGGNYKNIHNNFQNENLLWISP